MGLISKAESKMELELCQFENNNALHGGALYFIGEGRSYIRDSRFYQNVAGENSSRGILSYWQFKPISTVKSRDLVFWTISDTCYNKDCTLLPELLLGNRLLGYIFSEYHCCFSKHNVALLLCKKLFGVAWPRYSQLDFTFIMITTAACRASHVKSV